MIILILPVLITISAVTYLIIRIIELNKYVNELIQVNDELIQLLKKLQLKKVNSNTK